MTIEKLLTCLRGIDPKTEIGFTDEFKDFEKITNVTMRDGRVVLDSGYSNEENFWHPGNGNLGRDVRLLGHDWPA